MRSLGYDTIGFLVHFNSVQWKEIRKHSFEYSRGVWHFLREDKIIFEPKGYRNFRCNVNPQKILYGHNVTLTSPEELALALKSIEHLWRLVVSFPLNLSGADVRSVHLTYTEDTPFTYPLWRDAFVLPRKKGWIADYEPVGSESTGLYLNGPGQRINAYMKDEHLKYRGEILPQIVATECEHEHIIRVELRLDKLLRQTLSNRGLWTHTTLIGSDLCTPEGFHALVKYFLWRVPQCISEPKKKGGQPLSGLQQLALSSPKRFIKYWKRQCTNGTAQESALALATNEILDLEAKERPKLLLFGIREECKILIERYEREIPITGNMREK